MANNDSKDLPKEMTATTKLHKAHFINAVMERLMNPEATPDDLVSGILEDLTVLQAAEEEEKKAEEEAKQEVDELLRTGKTNFRAILRALSQTEESAKSKELSQTNADAKTDADKKKPSIPTHHNRDNGPARDSDSDSEKEIHPLPLFDGCTIASIFSPYVVIIVSLKKLLAVR